ncbi:unnamed protein product [Durusdinium trenchii]|uniref:BTB domain-containing protein n=3 Tax=Durusdinium trenchii TaxID=1381693 RepID=A0ABP0SKN9_9DINO
MAVAFLLRYERSMDATNGALRHRSWFQGFGIFDTEGYGVFMLSFETHEITLLAGDLRHWGSKDGVGQLARFWHLKRPVVNDRYLFMRTEGPAIYQWRQCRLDLKTLEVNSVIFEGVDHNGLLTYCASEREVYVVQYVGQGAQLLVASLEEDHEVQLAHQQFTGIDLAEPVSSVAFRLRCKAKLHVDRRILLARSEHFRKLLMADQTMTEIDLTGEAAADVKSFTVLLRFLMTDRWDAASVEPELAFNVRDLAQSFGLPRLMAFAEGHLQQQLSGETVLKILGRVIGSATPLEKACWHLLTLEREAILKHSQHEVDEIVQKNPDFAKKLILLGTGAPSDPVPSKRRRTWWS